MYELADDEECGVDVVGEGLGTVVPGVAYVVVFEHNSACHYSTVDGYEGCSCDWREACVFEDGVFGERAVDFAVETAYDVVELLPLLLGWCGGNEGVGVEGVPEFVAFCGVEMVDEAVGGRQADFAVVPGDGCVAVPEERVVVDVVVLVVAVFDVECLAAEVCMEVLLHEAEGLDVVFGGIVGVLVRLVVGDDVCAEARGQECDVVVCGNRLGENELVVVGEDSGDVGFGVSAACVEVEVLLCLEGVLRWEWGYGADVGCDVEFHFVIGLC